MVRLRRNKRALQVRGTIKVLRTSERWADGTEPGEFMGANLILDSEQPFEDGPIVPLSMVRFVDEAAELLAGGDEKRIILTIELED